MATFATAFPTTAPTTPNASSSLKRRMSPPHAPVFDATMMLQQQSHPQHTPPPQPSFKRARLSHNSPGELCLQRDLKSLAHAHQWSYQSHAACWVYEQDPNIRLHKSTTTTSTFGGFGGGEPQLQLLLEFSQDAHITIEFPRMYPHQTPIVTKIQGLWMDSILIRQQQQQQQQHAMQHNQAISAKTVVFDQWSPIIHLSTLLEFCIHHAKMHPTVAHAKLPTLGERTNTLHRMMARNASKPHAQSQTLAGNSENNGMMDVSHPFKYTSPFAPNRMDVGYNKQQEASFLMHQQQAPSQDAMEM